MKNRRKIMKYMNTKDDDHRFTILEIVKGTGLKKNQVDYEINLMFKDEIVKKLLDMHDLRKANYVKSDTFVETFHNT